MHAASTRKVHVEVVIGHVMSSREARRRWLELGGERSADSKVLRTGGLLRDRHYPSGLLHFFGIAHPLP